MAKMPVFVGPHFLRMASRKPKLTVVKGMSPLLIRFWKLIGRLRLRCLGCVGWVETIHLTPAARISFTAFLLGARLGFKLW